MRPRWVTWLLLLTAVAPTSAGAEPGTTAKRAVTRALIGPHRPISEVSRPIGEIALTPSEASRPIGQVSLPASAVSIPIGRLAVAPSAIGRPVGAVALGPSAISRPVAALALTPSAAVRRFGAVVVPVGQLDHVQLAPAAPLLARREVAELVEVVDADTLKVSVGDRLEVVHVLGVDSPEPFDLLRSGRGPQCYGRKARAAARAALLPGMPLSLARDPSQGNRDLHGRLIREVTLPDGRPLAAWLLGAGLAVEESGRGPYRGRAALVAAEAGARAAARGLWSADTCGGEFRPPDQPFAAVVTASGREPWLPCAPGQVKAAPATRAFYPPGSVHYPRLTGAGVWCLDSAARARGLGLREARR
jgi:endonuclease YncB( thermonuclease family)